MRRKPSYCEGKLLYHYSETLEKPTPKLQTENEVKWSENTTYSENIGQWIVFKKSEIT